MPAPLILPHYDFVPYMMYTIWIWLFKSQSDHVYSNFAHAPNQVTKPRSGYTFILVLHSKTVRNVL